MQPTVIIFRQWYAVFPLIYVGSYLVKTPASRRLTGKTPAVNKTFVYNRNINNFCAPPITIIVLSDISALLLQ